MTTDENGYANLEGIPYGTYTVKEKAAPKGFAKTDETATLIIDNPRAVAVSFSNLPQNDIMDIMIYKADYELEMKMMPLDLEPEEEETQYRPQKGATLEGAVFEVKFYGVDNQTSKGQLKNYQPERIWYIETDETGAAKLNADYLAEKYDNSNFYKDSMGNITMPLGIITIQEIEAPDGYLVNDDLFIKRITSSGTAETVDVYYEPTVYDQIKRGDFEFVKVSDGTMKRMGGVAFKITSLKEYGKDVVEGESHIIVTDDNGYFNSAASWNSYYDNVNANDEAWNGQELDESKLNSEAGIWFGEEDMINDYYGALPYGKYKLDELRCEGNIGHKLLKDVEFVISRDGVTIDLGTMTDDQILIRTTATDADTGKQLSYARDNYKLIDNVELKGIEKGTKYTLKGILMDKQTEMPLLVNGNEVTSEMKFTAKDNEQTVKVEFLFDARELEGKEVVVFESLYEGEHKVAVHEDIDDKRQTVKFVTPPSIGTPQTGDDSTIGFFIAMATVAAAAALYTGFWRRKKKDDGYNE